MATAPYNRAPGSLADLLAMQTNSVGSPTAPPVASQAPSIDTEGMLTAQQRSTLLDQIMNPQQTTATPADEQPQWGKKLASSFADALNNIATIYAGGPNLQSNYLQSYLNSIERGNADRKNRADAQSERDATGRTKKAEFLLTADDRARMREDDRIGRKELKDLTLASQEADRKQRVTEAAAGRAADLAEFNAKKAWDVEMETNRYNHDIAVSGHRRKIADGDRDAERDDKKLDVLMANIGEFVDQAEVMLNGGDVANEIPSLNAAQMNTRVRRMIEQARLGPEAKAVLETYYQKEAAPTLKKHILNSQNKEAMAAPTFNALTAQPSPLGYGSGH